MVNEIRNIVFVTHEGILVNTFDLPPGDSQIFWHIVHLNGSSTQRVFESPGGISFSTFPQGVTPLSEEEATIEEGGFIASFGLKNEHIGSAVSFNYQINVSPDPEEENSEGLRSPRGNHDPSIVVLPDPSLS